MTAGMFGRGRFRMGQDDPAFGLLAPGMQSAVDEYAQMDGLLAAAPQERPDGFWQGGEDFGVRDGIAGLLAVAGDALMRHGGAEGNAAQSLTGSRMSALDEFKQAAAQQRQIADARAFGPRIGVNPDQIEAKMRFGIAPQQPEKPPAIGQNLDYFMQNIQSDPRRMEAFRMYNSIVRPPMTGGDGQLYPNTAPDPNMPDFIPEEEWGGGTGNGVGGFRPR